MVDLIYEENGKWYFYNYASGTEGPFDTATDASLMFEDYCYWFVHGSSKIGDELVSKLKEFQLVLKYNHKDDVITTVQRLLNLMKTEGV